MSRCVALGWIDRGWVFLGSGSRRGQVHLETLDLTLRTRSVRGSWPPDPFTSPYRRSGWPPRRLRRRG